MSLPTSVIANRKSKLEPSHLAHANAVTSTPQTAAQLAAQLGGKAADSTKKLSLLLDEGLVKRGPGDPNTATYTLA